MSESIENTILSQDARRVIHEVRQLQAAGKKALRGRTGLDSAQRYAIRATAVSMAVAGLPPPIPQSELIRLLERFEEMARRQKIVVAAGVRPSILGLLATELWVNKHSLNISAGKLVAATVYHGAIGEKLHKEFPQFSDSPSLFRHATINYPADPEGFVRKTLTAIEEMSQEREFAEFLDTPGIFKQAAVRNPSDPRFFLITIQKTISEMKSEEEFSEFRDTPGFFKQAAISNLANPREYVRRLQDAIAEMKEMPEFYDFLNTPGIFRQAVIRNPKNPKDFLRKVKKQVLSISRDKEFIQFHDSPSVIQYAAMHNPSDPREFLRKKPKALWHAMLVKGREALSKSHSKRK